MLPKEEVEWWVHLLERDEKSLSLRNRQLRDDLVRYLKGDLKAWTVFGNRVIPEPPPQPQFVPTAPPPEPQPVALVGAVARTTSEILPGMGIGGELPEAKKSIWFLLRKRATIIIGILTAGAAFSFSFFASHKNASLGSGQINPIGTGQIDRIEGGGGTMVVLIGMVILFGAAAYFAGRLYGKWGWIAVIAGFVVVCIGLAFLGGLGLFG